MTFEDLQEIGGDPAKHAMWEIRCLAAELLGHDFYCEADPNDWARVYAAKWYVNFYPDGYIERWYNA